MSRKVAEREVPPDTGASGGPRRAIGRLTRPAEFKSVFQNPIVSRDAYFKVLACAGQAGYPRLGMAVSRQIDRSAVARNRIKRIIRESFRQAVATGAGTMPFDCVVLPRRECASICNPQLFQSLERHWQRIRECLASSGDAAGAPETT